MWTEYKLHEAEVGEKKKRKPKQNWHTKFSEGGGGVNNSMKLYKSMSVIDTLEHQKGVKEVLQEWQMRCEFTMWSNIKKVQCSSVIPYQVYSRLQNAVTLSLSTPPNT